jgi:hypothetical protein
MGRKKLNLQWVSNDARRRAMFYKRSQGLLKKTSELAKLCGVKVCILVYDDNKARPEVWPSVPEAKNLLASFKAMTEVQQWNNKMNHEDFIKKRISKLQEKVGRSDNERRGHETSILFHESMAGRMPGLVGVTPIEVIRLREVVERKRKAVQERLEQLGIQPEQSLPHQQLPTME